MKSRLLLPCLFIVAMLFASVGHASHKSKIAFDKDVGLSKIKKDAVKLFIVVPSVSDLLWTHGFFLRPESQASFNEYKSPLITKKRHILHCSIRQYLYGSLNRSV